MDFEPVSITLKDGRTALLRPPKADDAAPMLAELRKECGETEFLLRAPQECDGMTVEGEASWLKGMLDSPATMLIMCEVDGEIAGNCQIAFNDRVKRHHLAVIGIGLQKKFWGLGIGTAMFRLMEEEARRHPEAQLMELEFIEGNSRARALYEKMGFRVVGIHPNAVLLSSGPASLYIMQKPLR